MSGTQSCNDEGAWDECQCEPQCAPGTASCDGDASNGCETTLGTGAHCGGCDDACGAFNGTASCVDGLCALSCDLGFDDCDGDAANGCEAELSTIATCGDCGISCVEAYATAECVFGQCQLSCAPGFDDCDADPGNGCETPLGTISDCGSCGNACGEVNGSAFCGAGQCALTCDPGFADCDGIASNGCETDLTDPLTCGDCETICTGTCGPGGCQTCDATAVLDSNDPYDAARALGLCGGVLSAQWVLPDGTPAPSDPDYPLGHGLLNGFGPNVNPQQGALVLALSSGTARQPADPGYQPPSGVGGGFDKGYTCSHPLYAPQACSGAVGGTPHDGIALELQLQVPPTAAGLRFSLKFHTTDWPNFVCTEFNDQFAAILDPSPPGAIYGHISFGPQGLPITVNTPFLEVCPGCPLGDAELLGTGFESHGATGWLITTADVVPGTTITLRLGVYDAGDGAYDSTVLIDDFRWLSVPTIVETTPAPSPN